MNARILNIDYKHPADGWYQIEPKGEHPNRAAGVVQIIDDEAAQSIVNRFNADAAANRLRHGNEMLIDHEHFSDQPDQETRAYGWLQELQNRDDGIYARVRWTATGKTAVDGGDYRFFSTEYDQKDLKVLNDGKSPRRVRPLRLDGLTLTNMNNNRGQKPITNRDNLAASRESAANQNQNERTQTMKSIAKEVGLSDEASEQAILAEVQKLKNRVTTLEPLSTENGTLKNRLTALEAEQCDSLMTEHGIKADDTAKREKLRPVLAGLKNREDRLAFLKDCVPVEKQTEQATQQRQLRNRDTRQPDKTNPAENSDQELAIKISNRAAELRGKGLKFDAAWNQANREIKTGK